MGSAILRHLNQKEYWKYLGRSALGWLGRGRRDCPNCGAKDYQPISRKLVVTLLVRCRNCRILYRIPNDPCDLTDALYQENYTADVYSDAPDAETLRGLVESGFAGSSRTYARYISAIKALGIAPGQRVLEVGASWGYGVWQLREAGFDAAGYEIGRARVRYARDQLGVPVEDDLARVGSGFDCVFSAHVLEHIPRPADMFLQARQALRPGGLFVAVTPNGCAARMLRDRRGFQHDWGMYHPIFLDDEFYCSALPDRPYLLAASPWNDEQLAAWDRRQTTVLELGTSGELLLATFLGEPPSP